MSIALGVHVGVDEISAVLIEADLPELGPVAARTAAVASVPGGVGDAATTMLGIMRVQAAQQDLLIARSAIVCDSLLVCGIVRAALTAHQISDVLVVDAGDPRLDGELPLGTAAALIGIAVAPSEWTDDGDSTDSVPAEPARGARLAMIGLGVAVLAALSGATVWALTAIGPAENSVVGTADTTDVGAIPRSGSTAISPSSTQAVAGVMHSPADPATIPPVETELFESPVFGPVPVASWSEAPPAAPVPTPAEEVSAVGGGSDGGQSGGGRKPGGGVGGGNSNNGNSGEDSGGSGGGNSDGHNSGGGVAGGGDSGGGSEETETPTVDPEPETEEPTTDPPSTTTDVPATTEATSTVSEPSEGPVE